MQAAGRRMCFCLVPAAHLSDLALQIRSRSPPACFVPREAAFGLAQCGGTSIGRQSKGGQEILSPPPSLVPEPLGSHGCLWKSAAGSASRFWWPLTLHPFRVVIVTAPRCHQTRASTRTLGGSPFIKLTFRNQRDGLFPAGTLMSTQT